MALCLPGEACSPDDYKNEQARLDNAKAYVDGAQWIAIGKVRAFEEVSIAAVWRQYKDYPNESVMAGIEPGIYALLRSQMLKGVRYEFEIEEVLKGDVTGVVSLWSADFTSSAHPRKTPGKWESDLMIGSHGHNTNCAIFPAFEIGQGAVLIKRKRLTESDFDDVSDPDFRVEMANIFSRPQFRDLEPTEGNEEWVAAIRSFAAPVSLPE